MNLIDAERKISVSKSHNYTKEKVLIAEEYLSKNSGYSRNINVDELIRIYNTIKGVNVDAGACKSCGIEKYLIGIKNYVKYGRMVLLNENPHVFDDVEDIKEEPIIEDNTERIITGIEEETPVEDNKEVITKKSNAKSKNK